MNSVHFIFFFVIILFFPFISPLFSIKVFVFVTISKFGALNCALIGLGRKMLTLLLSFILYGHTMNSLQVVGLSLSLAAMIANFKGKSKGKVGEMATIEGGKKDVSQQEKVGLMSDIDEVDDREGNFLESADDNYAASPSKSERSDLLDFEVEV